MRRGAIFTFVGIGILAILYFVRPLFHSVYIALYANPHVLVAIALFAIGAIGASLLSSNWARAVISIIVIPWVLWMLHVGSDIYPSVHIANTLEVTSIEKLPKTEPENTRFLPRIVARNYVSSSLREPRYRAGKADVTFLDGRPYWSFPLMPEGWYNEVYRKVKGAHYVDMTRSGRHIEQRIKSDRTPNYELTVGPGLKYFDNYSWVLPKHEYNVNYQEPFVVPHENRLYLAVPFIEYEYALTYGVPHSVPKWGGVALIRNDGRVTIMGPDEAQKSDVLSGQRLVPFSLSRYYAQAFKYRHGYMNTLWGHKGEIEIAPLPGQGNDQPFLISTMTGPAYVVAAEPYGTAYGLSEIYVMDARSGQVSRYSAGANKTLDGPARATDRVWSELPKVNRDGYEMAEPLPAMRNGRLYWNVRLMPKESSGISYIAFVDAESRTVRAFEGVDEARTFLSQKSDTRTTEVGVENRSVDDSPSTSKSTAGVESLRIDIRNADGKTTETIRVKPGQTLTITVPEAPNSPAKPADTTSADTPTVGRDEGNRTPNSPKTPKKSQK